MIDDIRIDMNKVKASKEGKKVFNDLNKLIIGINNNKDKREDAVGGLNKSISDLDQLKQKQIIAFQNKLIHVVYQLFLIKSLHHSLANYNQSRLKKTLREGLENHYGSK